MTYNKHKKTVNKRSNKRSNRQRGGAWYNPLSWFGNNSSNEQQANGQQQGNSILGTFNNLTNKTEEAFKNAGQGLSNITNNTKDAFSGILAPKKQTPANNMQQQMQQQPMQQQPMLEQPMPKALTPVPRMVQEKEKDQKKI